MNDSANKHRANLQVLKQEKLEKFNQTNLNLMKFLDNSKYINYLIILFVFVMLFVSLNPFHLNKILIVMLRLLAILFNIYIIIILHRNTQKLNTLKLNTPNNDEQNVLLFSKITTYCLMAALTFFMFYSMVNIAN
jgi:hypothetical protein